MSKDEINRILSLENTSLLERLLWVNNLKLKKWQKEFSKQQAFVVKSEAYHTSKWKRDIYKALTNEIDKKL